MMGKPIVLLTRRDRSGFGGMSAGGNCRIVGEIMPQDGPMRQSSGGKLPEGVNRNRVLARQSQAVEAEA
jgi:hypothetical protein